MHYLTKHFELKNKTLGCTYFPGEHTGQTIFLKIKNMVSKWGIDAENSNTPIYIVTDNARNITHTLQLAINDAVKENNMGDVLKKCRSLVSHYNHSVKSYERLYDIQTRLNLPQHKLIQSIDIRWNSIYLMLERILEQKSAITLDLQNIKKNGFVPRDWKLIEGYVEVLKPIFEATKELCQEKIPTLSMVNPILYPRFKIVMLEPHEVDAAKEILKIEVEAFRTPPSNLQIINETTEYTLEPSKSSLWDILNERSATIKHMEGQIDYVLREIQEYLKLPLISPTSNPLTWWSSNQTTFPNLLPVAMKYLGIPATSVCSERMFSKAGQIVTKRRQRLSPESVEKLVRFGLVENIMVRFGSSSKK
ncbi:zinc finger BED domain-containing protein 4-like [Melanaphis sacchari]|uniref:zinc finger BED domain-containing protein 4-like n=1 Tax=Melanaphis sacchari TaxID=742174 RepID=UPI000DC14EEC|nr:zinc finger BED domain-containing protein 4-like [Melanaphis sacchari]